MFEWLYNLSTIDAPSYDLTTWPFLDIVLAFVTLAIGLSLFLIYVVQLVVTLCSFFALQVFMIKQFIADIRSLKASK